MQLDADIGGRAGDGRVLVLLHGMGATREVWRPLIRVLEPEWNGRWLAPDLRGHGRSPHAKSYAVADHAADVSDTMRTLVPDARAITVLGHSMGGAIALTLASGAFGLQPRETMALGIKMVWTPPELEGLRKLANTPTREFESRDAAVSFYIKVAGLTGLVAPDDPIAQAGVSDDGRTLRADNVAASVGPPSMESLVGAARGELFFAAGARDSLCSLDNMKAYNRHAQLIESVGHNAMLESPEDVWVWITTCIDVE